MKKRILLVEDSKEIHRQVLQALEGPLIEIVYAESIADAESLFEGAEYNLILLDINLPDGNGIQFCSKITATHPHMPIFFLTGKDDLSEKVLGFSAGADDYITKPFDTLELKARVEARLKKAEMMKVQSNLLKWKELSIDKGKQEVLVSIDGEFKPVDLTALEFKLLTYFASQPGQVISRDTILDEIWGKDVHIYSRSVDTHVSKLRKKLDPNSDVIESVHGAGYKFNPTT